MDGGETRVTMDAGAVLQFCSAHSDEMRRDLERLVALESPSHDKAAVDRCGAALAGMLRACGASVRLLPQAGRGDHLRAEIGGGRCRVLLLGHFDTVWDVGQLSRMPLCEKDGRLFGPGIFDMKAGIVIAIMAARALRTLAPAAMPTVVMLWTTDEEVGSETSRAAIELEAQASDAVLVLEPSLPGGAVKTRRKGCGEFVLTARGVSAHAGIDPSQGASAVHELAFQIGQLELLNDPAKGISVNVGVIAGGTRANVVAEGARAVVDVRVPSAADGRYVEERIRALRARHPRVQLEITGGVERPPLERSPGVARLFEQARVVAGDLGQDLQEGGTGGGSDGNFTAAMGVPTLDGLGPRGDGAHALHEHVLLQDLPWRAAFLARLLVSLER
jgi:glutamate carboxypeptidase